MSDTPRIYTRCPACGNDTLTINDDKHLLCTWISCPNPTLIDRVDRRMPVLENEVAVRDILLKARCEAYDTALATIAERDRRIAELTKRLVIVCTERDTAFDKVEEYETDRDTATRELAEAKAEIARLMENAHEVANLIVGNMNEVPNTNERCALNLLHRMIQPKGGDAPCPDSLTSKSGSNAAHDTSDPSVERQEHYRSEYGNLAELLLSALAERDQLKAENVRYVDMSGRFANEVALLKAENEKLRATITAKDSLLQRCDGALSDLSRFGYVGNQDQLQNAITDALSPAIANEFVRRDAAWDQLLDWFKGRPGDSWKATITDIEHAIDGISRAETALKGKQP